ncbi:MAG: hypothetical protein AMS26_21375 [Bacteroides sp. SM23_62]|nr:MAG: hypothetical protein AMS26_21375 [Bacteroides sp. SM23_62]
MITNPIKLSPKFFRAAFMLILAYTSTGFAQAQSKLDLANYCTKVRLSDDLEISLYTPTMFRVRISALEEEKFPPRYEIPFVIGKLSNWEPVDYRQWDEGEYHCVETAVLRIRMSGEDLRWEVWSRGGEKQIFPSEGKIYGMFRDGYTVFDNASAFDERNNNSRYSHWFYNPETKRYVDTYLHEDLIYDRYFIYGPDYPSLFSQFNELTGPAPLLPLKGYGFFQTQHLGCTGTQEKLIQLARDLRERDIPCDNLIIDFEWGDGCPGQEEKFWGQLDWSPEYQHPLTPEQMISTLDSMHFKVMLIHHSAPDFPNRAINTPLRVRDWTSRVYPEDLWWEKLHEKMDIGIVGTWQDTRQNDITDGIIWKGMQDYIGPGNRVYFMGCRKMMDLNPFEVERDNTLPANNMIGTRRYPFKWPGDVHNTYRELKWQINAITNTHGSMKGVSYITADCFGKNWKIQARWNQFIDFNSVSKSHTNKPWQKIMNFHDLSKIMDFTHEGVKVEAPGKEELREAYQGLSREELALLPTAENSIRKHRKVRYRMIPYIYSAAYENYLTGMPICRPMLLAFPDDLRVNRDQWPYQYMFGENLLVAPVYADLNSMEIYLPEGFQWIDYWDKTVYDGGQIIDYNTSDIEKLPLFIRSGAIIPMRKDQNWIETGEVWDPLTLDIYPDSVSSFTLFEDDGRSINYQKGEYSKTVFECNADADKIFIRAGRAVGAYAGMPVRRSVILQVNLLDECPYRVIIGRETSEKNEDREAFNTTSSGWYYDRDNRMVHIKFGKASSEETNVQIIMHR